MASNSRTTDMTKGNPMKAVLLFAIPLYLSNIFQQFYNLTDISIIGHALGDDALSAIGSVSTIYGMFNSLLFGMSNGFSVVISRFFGSKDPKGLKRAVANTTFLAALWVIAVTLIGTLSLKPIMHMLHTPEELFDTAYSYISVTISLIVFSFTYNILAGMLRAIGNSKAPLFFLIVSVFTNIGLDLYFVYVLKLGLRGAAIATVSAQAIACIVSFIYIWLKVPELHFSKEDFVLNKNLIIDLFSSGISFALMYMVVNLGTMILQGAINSLGNTTIGAHTTARKISELCMMMLSTLANSMSTFSGQNHGAGSYDRIREGYKKILLLSFAVDAALILFIYTFGERLVRLISDSSNPELISTAVFYLRFDLPFYFVLSVILITRTTLQGLGAKWTPIVASVMELILKIFTAGWLAKRLGYLGIAMCEPMIWIVCAAYIFIIFYNNKEIKNSKKKKVQIET